MGAVESLQVTDSRETVEAETRYNTFEILMLRVDAGELSFESAVAEYRVREIGELATIFSE